MNKILYNILILVICFVLYNNLYAQQKNVRPNKVAFFSFQEVPIYPMGEMGKKFGIMNGVGFGIGYKNNARWQLGLYGRFYFGNRFNMDNPLQYIVTSNGDIINMDGSLIQPRFYSRGIEFIGEYGKVFRLNTKRNTGTGYYLSLGAGYIQHKIRIEIPGEGAPQLYPDYKHGYDRFHSGLMIKQTLCFQYMDPKYKTLNFQVGVELSEAWTKNRRGYNYDLRAVDNQTKFDLYPGLRLAWILPRYIKTYVDQDGFRFK